MLLESCQPVLPDTLYDHYCLVLTMLHTVYYLETEVRVPALGKMSTKWGTLVLNLPPVAGMSLMHGFSCLPRVLGGACLAGNQLHYIGGFAG